MNTHTPNVHFQSDKQDHETPDDFFEELDREFGFQVDVCATHENAKCPIFISADSLEIPWHSEAFFGQIQHTFWMNPPYGREIGKWVKKAYEESREGCTVVCLITYRPDTKYWFDYIWEPETQGSITYGRKPRKGVEVRAIKGRLKFKGSENSAPFPSAIVIFTPNQGNILWQDH